MAILKDSGVEMSNLKKMSSDLSDMTIDLFDNITKKLARTPIKFH